MQKLFTIILITICLSPAKAQDPLFQGCHFANADLSFHIDSCHCDTPFVDNDTVHVDIFPPVGGDILGHCLRITLPKSDINDKMLFFYQTRLYLSSMGPDPMFTQWHLYTSKVDTLYHDTQTNGFAIPGMDSLDWNYQEKIDTADFYKMIATQSWDKSTVPKLTKAQTKEYNKLRKERPDLIELVSAELHRVYLIHGRIVFIFTYGHFG